jgi:hypothetical protein
MGGIDQLSVVDSPHPLFIWTTPALAMPRALKVLNACKFGQNTLGNKHDI